MPEEDQPILDPTPGMINKLDEPTINNRAGIGASNVNSGLASTQERNKKDRESKLLMDKGEHYALAMLVEIVMSPYPPNTIPSSTANETDELKKYLKIYARVPEFDSALPMPDTFKNFRPSGVVTKTKSIMRDLVLVRQHPCFIQELPNQNNENAEENQIPTPGSLIKVKYDDKQHKTGTYLGVYKDGYKLGNISEATDPNTVQTPQSLRNQFDTSAQNIINDDLGPLVTIGQMEYKPFEDRIAKIADNALPGPVINGKQTILMFNLSPRSGASTNYNNFNLSHYGNKVQNLFVILESEEVLKPAIRVMLMSSVEGYNLKVNSSFRPSIPILTVGDVLKAVNREAERPTKTYSNWNRVPDTQIGEINIYALKNFLETLNPNTKILSSQRSLRNYFDCPNDTTTNCRVKVAPVGRSKHESGFAIDLNTSPPENYTWMVNNMYKYGFYRTVKSERWHWRFNNTNKKVNVFSVINRFHETWDGNSLPTSDSVNSMPLQTDGTDE